jgi:hypothetical protein
VFLVSCSGVGEIDPQQDVLMWSKQPVFKLQLCLSASGQPVFNPAFTQVETMAQAVLDGAVRTTFDIPRIGSQMMVAGSASNNAGKTSANSVPTMDLEDVELNAVCNSVVPHEISTTATPFQQAWIRTQELQVAKMMFASCASHCQRCLDVFRHGRRYQKC